MTRSLTNSVALLLMLVGTGHATACQAQLRAQAMTPTVVHSWILPPAISSGAVSQPTKEPYAVSGAKRPAQPVTLKPSRPVRLRAAG